MSEPVVVNLRFLARELGLPLEKLQPAVELLDEGHPVPFIARYRKDVTGGLDEEQLRAVQSELQTQRTLAERKQTILRSIDSLGKLTPELDHKIREAKTSKRLEDIYLPYKPKKQTLASLAKSRGLQPLAMEILEAVPGAVDPEVRAADFINPDKDVTSVADALLGAGHIISEMFSERLELRHRIREIVQRTSVLVSQKIETKKEPALETKKNTEKAEKDAPAAPPQETPQSECSETPIPEPVVASAVGQNIEGDAAISDQNATDDTPKIPSEHTAEPADPAQTPPTEPEGEFRDGAGAGGGEPEPEAESELADRSESEPEPAAETTVEADSADDSEEITREFQQLQNRRKEEGVPVVRSQNQLKKKKKAKKAKEKAAQQQRQKEHLEKLFHDYFDFTSEARKLPPHRILAINRGEKAKVLRVKFETDRAASEAVASEICVANEHPCGVYLGGCVRDALQRLLVPVFERELRSDMTERAEQHAVRVFAKNLRHLLLQPPLHRKKVLALDPGFKHGCKMVALDEFGNVLEHETVYPTGNAEKRRHAEERIVAVIRRFGISVIAVGNGTACRETEDFISKIIARHFTPEPQTETDGSDGASQCADVSYVIVNEAGASVYSASPLAKEEFPNYDILLRGAISIGRRLQDPLNELVKIEPVSLGVGMYQHDLKAKHLRDALNDVVESCVNFVGVDLNTATPPILRYVSGLNQLTAKRIYEYRLEHGPFKTREDLKKVPGLGEVAFTHCAGFLRIADGPEPLDATWIHPEMYENATNILRQLGFAVGDLRSSEALKAIAEKTKTADVPILAEALGIGPLAVTDILRQLARPGRDPREELPPPIFKKGVLKMEDLTAGMELNGTILNVVDFGAFVDIGLHDSGLIHISQMAGQYVRDACDYVSVGDIVRVWVVDVDPARKRISLTMIPPGTAREPEKSDRGGRRRDRNRHAEGENRSENRGENRGERGDLPRSDGSRGGAPRGGLRNDKDSRNDGDSRGDSANRGPQRRFGGGRPSRDGETSRGGGSSERRRDSRGERGDRSGRGGRYDGVPKTYRFANEKTVAPISEEMKKGKEPLRSFGDLAQLFGRVQVVDPEEEKRKKKEERKIKREHDDPARPEPSPGAGNASVANPSEENATSGNSGDAES